MIDSGAKFLHGFRGGFRQNTDIEKNSFHALLKRDVYRILKGFQLRFD